MDNDPAEQFHFDPRSYAEMVRREVPAYVELQEATAQATDGVVAERVLDLGVGTGETASRVLALHPGAHLTGIDESSAMVEFSSALFAEADLRVSRIEDSLPEGIYDLVVSALAVHHLEDSAKADLFRRVAAQLRPGGRFVLADLVVPDDPADALTPVDDDGYDKPSPVADQLLWLRDAGFEPSVFWAEHDLVVIAADLA
jgi:tRNA (cmo5U34)-methyltransferase